jgi:hypothetical protein
MKIKIIVMPAWMAGIQFRKDALRRHPYQSRFQLSMLE